MTERSRVVIIGGGIAGLAAAHRLQQLAPDVETVLIERDSRLGGNIQTERVDGFVIEAGPDSFLSSKPAGLALCRELGLEDRLQGTREDTRRTFVMKDGRLHPLPEGLSGLVPSRLEPLMQSDLFSPEGKERLMLEPRIPAWPYASDESLASFVERRFGREVYERLIEPLMAGIYAGDGERLSLQATFPQLRRLEQEHGSLILGLEVAQRQAEVAPEGKKPAAFLTPLTGMAEIVEALARRLDSVRVLTDTCASSVRSVTGGYELALANGDTVAADAIVLSTPAFVTAALLRGIDPELARPLESIEYVSTATVSVAYRAEDIPRPLDGYGYITPRVESRTVLACSWTSSKFAHRAPEGYSLLRAFIGRAGMEEMLGASDEELLDLVRGELCDVLGIKAEPVLHRIFRWPEAMPQYRVGHLDVLARFEERLQEHPGVFVAGSAYRGIGIPDCISSGETATRDTIAFLQSGASELRLEMENRRA